MRKIRNYLFMISFCLELVEVWKKFVAFFTEMENEKKKTVQDRKINLCECLVFQ